MVGEIKNKANSAQLELELGLSLAKMTGVKSAIEINFLQLSLYFSKVEKRWQKDSCRLPERKIIAVRIYIPDIGA